MINVFRKIWNFSGKESVVIKKSVIVGLFHAIFGTIQFGAIYVILKALIENDNRYEKAVIAFLLMLLSVAGKIVTNYFSQLQRTHAGFFMVANKRKQIGEKLKAVPMGYFNKNSLGNITAITTTILSDVENTSPIVLVKTLGGFMNAVIFTALILIFHWQSGVLVVIGMVLFLLFTSLQEKKSRYDAPKRQEAQEELVEAVLETIQGIAVVKAFNLDEVSNKKVDLAIEKSCSKNMHMEKAMTPYIAIQQMILKIFSVLIILNAIMLYLNNGMILVDCIMMIVASFIIFQQLEIAGLGTAALRLTENSIDRANSIDDVPVINEGDKNADRDNLHINFENVSFSYEKQKVLKNINLSIAENSMTAIVGPSGSGKSTLCNLIARFWDVEEGEIRLGKYNIKEYNLDDLMSNISMVFQKVYLFEDTIENNIKFGKNNATEEEVIEAAKKACCDEFISKLPNGYKTVIGEGGASLSGGEKQRISIARAILKDAQIVIFDEATANVDPENEDRLQSAILELTKNKTVIMIAHRLKTVKNANQIIVLNDGEIVQKGTHTKLIKEKGIYYDFIKGREEVIGWKLKY